jgi:hypothetical protein
MAYACLAYIHFYIMFFYALLVYSLCSYPVFQFKRHFMHLFWLFIVYNEKQSFCWEKSEDPLFRQYLPQTVLI